MDIPNILKGNYYPSSRVARCPRFHMCTVTKKCQSFDRHLLECNVCESRTNTHEIDPTGVPIGGHLPEGEYYPDLQDAFAKFEKLIGKSFAHPDAVPQSVRGPDIARKQAEELKTIEMIKHFSNTSGMHMDEKIMQAMVDPNLANLLGRME